MHRFYGIYLSFMAVLLRNTFHMTNPRELALQAHFKSMEKEVTDFHSPWVRHNSPFNACKVVSPEDVGGLDFNSVYD